MSILDFLFGKKTTNHTKVVTADKSVQINKAVKARKNSETLTLTELWEQYPDQLTLNEHLIHTEGPYYAIVSAFGKQATSLKEKNLAEAAKKIADGVAFAKKVGYTISLDYALRRPIYLHGDGQRDEAFKALAEIAILRKLLQRFKAGSRDWFASQAQIIHTRCQLLASENTLQSWEQYIFDAILLTHYEANEKLLSIRSPNNSFDLEQSKKLLIELSLFDEIKQLEKLGWKGFVKLNLEKYQSECFTIGREWAKQTPPFDLDFATNAIVAMLKTGKQ